MVLTRGRLAAIAIGIPLALAMAGWSAFSAVGQFSSASERHTASYDWHGGPIVVNTGSGSVRVRAGTTDRIDVVYTEHYQLKKPTVSATTANGGVQLAGKCPGGLLGNNCEVNYELTVPAATKLQLHSGSGGLHVVGITGNESLDTGDGGITLESVSGEVVAHTGNGGIRGTQLRAASVEARTGDGGIGFDWTTAPTKVVAITGNGGINLVVPAGSGPYRTSTRTGNGSVTVLVRTDPGAPASITAQTGDGGITIGNAN
jgi:DUF4097 and DUF4098 domain-containing protein YvlB